MKPSRFPVFLRRALALTALTSLGSSPALAATWYWDTDSVTSGAQQTSGTWTDNGSTWWNGTATVPWVNAAGNIAHFGTEAGAGITGTADADRTIAISGTVNAAGLILNSTTLSSYILSGGEIALANGSTIDVKGSDATDLATKRHRITGTISGADIKIARTTTSTLAMLRLFGSNTWTGTLTLSSTATEGIFVEAVSGAALNNLTTVSVGVNSSLILAAASTFTPGFSINGTGAGGNRGAIRFDTTGGNVAGAVTLDGNAIINASSGITGTITGPINQVNSSRTLTLNATGGGNLILSANNNFVGPVTLTSGSLTLNGNNTFAGILSIAGNNVSLLGENQFTGTGKITLNGGSLTLGSPTSVKAMGSVAKPIELSGTTNTIVAVVGPGGFTAEQFANLPALATSGTGSAAYGMSAQADINFSGALFGNLAFAKSGPGTLTLLGTRTDSGGITIREGTLRITDIANGGQNSSIGTSSSAAASLVLSGGRLMYAGPEAQTDRLFTMTASSVIDSSGSGPLRFANAGSIAHVGTGARTLTLSGYAPGENRIVSIIPNAGSGAVSITKQGSASWTLAGTNLHTGATRNNGGLFTLDYTSGDPVSSTGTVHLNAGEIRIKGTPGGITKSLGTFLVGTNQHASGTLKLDGKVNLTLTSLTSNGLVQRSDLIDISSNPANSISVTGAATSISVVNGVLQANAATPVNGRANIILRNKDGSYSFPTLSATLTSGEIIPATLNLITSASSLVDNTQNYKLTKGSYSATADMLFNTITLDSTAATVSSANEINFSLAAKQLAPSVSGKGLLMVGNNNVNITNFEDTRRSASQPIWFHNYLQPNATFNLEADFDTQFLIFSGSGFTDFKGTGYADNFFVLGSLVRLSANQYIPSNDGNFRIATGGVMEIGEVLYQPPFTASSSFRDAAFVKPVRSAGTGGIAFYGDSGLSAYSSDLINEPKRVVHFSNDTTGTPNSQDLTWGAARFLTQPDSDADGDYSLKLSSLKANATLELRNNINLNGRSRNVQVENGSAVIDGQLSGVLSGSDASGLIKSGAGTLQLSGQNTYKGETRVQDGVLMVGVGNLNPASTVSIITPDKGGTGKLDVTGDVTVAGVSIDGVAQSPGQVSKPGVITGSGRLYVGGVLTPYQQWAAAKLLGSGENAGDFDADFDGLKNLIEYAIDSNPKTSTPSALTQVAGTPTAVRFNRAAGRTDLKLYLESSTTLTAPWTVIATSTAGAAMVSSVGATVTVSETSGVVTVTDNRTPAGTKIFYRLRAEIP